MDATLLDAEAEAAVLRVYRQVFAVLAREAGAMIVDPDLLDVDQAILDAFAEAGSDGLTVEQATLACRAYPHDVIVRRFEAFTGKAAVLSGGGASFEETAEQRQGATGTAASA